MATGAEPCRRCRITSVVRKLMAKRPEDRYQTPADLAAALAAVPVGTAVTQRMRRVVPAADALQTTPVSSDTLTGPLADVPRHSAARWKVLAAAGAFIGLVFIGACLALWSRVGNGQRGQASSGRDEGAKPIVNSIGMQVVRIPAGKFMMGSPESEEGRKPHEGPQHEVVITRPFYMGAHEVTVGQFRTFVRATGYQTEGERSGQGANCYTAAGETLPDPKCTWQNPGWTPSDDQPVNAVSRNDAVAFCDWLSKKEGKPYRLPTEAEWEYACRAGTSTPFHTGGKLTQAHFNANTIAGTAGPAAAQLRPKKVGSYPPNTFGLYDMHGNVWEWCADWYEENYYRQSPRENPAGPTSGAAGVFRGGGFEVDPLSSRSAFRFAMDPSFRHVVIGFRVVRSDP